MVLGFLAMPALGVLFAQKRPRPFSRGDDRRERYEGRGRDERRYEERRREEGRRLGSTEVEEVFRWVGRVEIFMQVPNEFCNCELQGQLSAI